MQKLHRATLITLIVALTLTLASLRTSPAIARPQASATSFHFVVAGDSRDDYSVLPDLSHNMVTLSPVFGVFVGDLCGSFDTTCINNTWKPALDGNDNDGMLARTFVSRGNHDNGSLSSWQGLWDFASMAGNVGATNYSALSPNATYSFDYGNSHFAIIDLPGGGSNSWSSSEISWLDADLTAAEGRGVVHEFLFAHGPMYGVTSEHGGESPSSALKAVLNAHPISAGFHGHEHVTAYAHVTTSLESGLNSYEQFTVGRAGAPPYSVKGYTDWHADQNAFADVAVNGNDFTVTIYSQGGAALFSRTFTSTAPNTPVATFTSEPTNTPATPATTSPATPTALPTLAATPSTPPTATAKPVAKDAGGVFRPSNGALYLKNNNTTGFADISINYGLPGDKPVTGDWDGNGTDTIGVYRNGVFYLRNSNTSGPGQITVAFGAPGDQPIAGDWNHDGIDTIGVYRSSTITFYLRNSNTSGPPNITFQLGLPGDVGLAGDWNGDGLDTTGVFRPSNGALYLKNSNTTGYADLILNYGLPGDKPVTGDWNNDGIDTIGIYRNGQFWLRNSNTVGYGEIGFALGVSGDIPIAGNWDGLP